MDPKPTREPEIPEVTHRRRRLSTWQKTPKWVKIAGAVCLGLLAISLATGSRIIEWSQNRSWSQPSPAAEPARNPRVNPGKVFDEVASKIQPFELELSGAQLNPVTHRIEGTLLNKSERAYANIRIRFALPTQGLEAREWNSVAIPSVGPRGSTHFVSDPLPAGVREWSLLELTGTPVKPR